MNKTKITELNEFGQSVWLDYISRCLIDKGGLKTLIDAGLRGMTSNPTIFDKAVSSGADYDEKIAELSKSGKSTFEIYDDLTVKDVQDAADMFMPVYEASQGLDGYVSLEINPKLAYNSQETIDEGRRLCQKVHRANVMFKIPSTQGAFEAIEELLACGMNLNVTLIFSQEQYINTACAYIKGMRRFLGNNGDAGRIRSVASVFVSRIDSIVDKLLDEMTVREEDRQKKEKFAFIKGKAAAANSALIYKKYLEIFSSHEFKQLETKGVHVQRVLWGSTSTKNPAYSDVKYVTELIAKNTVNTMPESTFNAFLDHGRVIEALTADTRSAEEVIEHLNAIDIDVNTVCSRLLEDGVFVFEKSFESLLNTIERKTRELCLK